MAYWGDKIHRASWIGALVLFQCAGYVILIIPHLTHKVRIIEETLNVTHMSLYAGNFYYKILYEYFYKIYNTLMNRSGINESVVCFQMIVRIYVRSVHPG